MAYFNYISARLEALHQKNYQRKVHPAETCTSMSSFATVRGAVNIISLYNLSWRIIFKQRSSNEW